MATPWRLYNFAMFAKVIKEIKTSGSCNNLFGVVTGMIEVKGGNPSTAPVNARSMSPVVY